MYRDDEYGNEKQMLFPRKKKWDFPPVTPHACVKDNIGASAFDFVWSEVYNNSFCKKTIKTLKCLWLP